jgi:hypothetical protein
MIWMAGAVRRPAEVPQMLDAIPGRGLRRKARRQLSRLIGHVEAVEAVEEGEAIALAEEIGLPGTPGLCHAARRHRLDQNDAGAEAGKVEPGEHVGLRAFHVDLEEIDRPEPGLLEETGEVRRACGSS